MAFIEKSYCRFVLAGWSIAAALLLTACGSSGCYENRSSIPQAKFYAYNMPSQAVAIDSITVYGIGQPNDSLLLDAAKNVSSMYLPFRNDADTTQYVIRYDMSPSTAYNDTLTFVYRRYPYFISGDCGVVFNYTVDDFSYTRNMLDSAALVAPEVTNKEVETIQLFYYVVSEK